MKKRVIRIFALVLALLLLTGCGNLADLLPSFGEEYVAYADMEYSRPDMQALETALDAAIDASFGDDTEALMDLIYGYYDLYDRFYTCYSLADLRYCADLTDIYWEKEYNFCLDSSATADAGLEELYYALAKSPCREELESEDYFGAGFFDSYEGDNYWDAEFVALLEAESDLIARYYELSEQALEYTFGTEDYYEICGEKEAELLVELIRVRQQMADYCDYPDFVSFANDFYHSRDYTPQQMTDYLAQIRQELVPLYLRAEQSERWKTGSEYCSEKQTYDYVRKAANNMGGLVLGAFEMLRKAELYDISYGENKYSSSFEVYLLSYDEPFIFMNPSLTTYDRLTFAHEFGHFCNDYASYGSYASTDVAEIFSQSMEYLSLVYADAPEELVWLKMADCLCIYVEQAAFADFEQRMYALEGEDLSVEGLCDLYSEVATAYGFGSTGFTDWEFVGIDHFYSSPMYIISYVISNDAALQLYQMELEQPGAGLACFEENLDTTAYGFMEFLETAGLESPLAEGRIAAVRQTMEKILE
jgi:hypothetical protein